jgi:hypothetical protein
VVSMNDDLTTAETGNTTPIEDNKMMASFRIDRDLWVKFGRLAKSERLTATDILTDYIQRCTDNDRSQYAIGVDTYETDKLNDIVIMMVNTAIEASLQSSVQVIIASALEPITEQVKEVRSSTESQLRAVRGEIEKALVDRVKSNSIDQSHSLEVIVSKTKVKKSPPQSHENSPTTASKMSWGEFHSMVELEPPPTKHKNRANADIALDRAKTMGFTGWKFTGDKNFVKK